MLKRFIFDIALTATLAVAAAVLQNWPWRPPVSGFIASYNHLIWAALSAIVFGMVAVFAWRVLQSQTPIVSRLVEIAIIIMAANMAACLFFLTLHPNDDAGTVFGFALIFTFLPALLASVGIFLSLAAIGRFL